MNRKEAKALRERYEALRAREKFATAAKDFARLNLPLFEEFKAAVGFGERKGVDGRECGQCKACCFTLPIETLGLDKPPYQWCRHSCEAGCAVYTDRPDVCKHYLCAYMHGKVDVRPDECGLVIDFQPDLKGIPPQRIEIAEVWKKAAIEAIEVVMDLAKFRLPIVYYPFLSEEDGARAWRIKRQEALYLNPDHANTFAETIAHQWTKWDAR